MPINYRIPTTAQNKLQEIEKLSKEEKFCLDAFIVSKQAKPEKLILAYELSRPRESKANRQSIYVLARKWINTNACKFYIEQQTAELFTPTSKRKENKGDREQEQTENTPPNSNRTKGDTIDELNDLATDTADPKLKAEILLKISDLEGWKKEQITTEDDTRRYYLPLSCHRCELYKAANMAHGKS